MCVAACPGPDQVVFHNSTVQYGIICTLVLQNVQKFPFTDWDCTKETVGLYFNNLDIKLV